MYIKLNYKTRLLKKFNFIKFFIDNTREKQGEYNYFDNRKVLFTFIN